MPDTHEKGAFEADIPADAVEEALRSVERVESEAVPVETGAPEPATSDPAVLAAEVERLAVQLELSQAKGRETLEKLRDEHDRRLRASADLENYKKRAQRERDEIQKFGAERLLKDLLPIVDNLDRALAAAPPTDPLADGVRLVRASLEQVLAKHGVKAFSALGLAFDPAVHEALLQVPSDAPAGSVVLEHGRGFMLGERLLRPAMVGVAVASSPAAGGDGPASHEG